MASAAESATSDALSDAVSDIISTGNATFSANDGGPSPLAGVITAANTAIETLLNSFGGTSAPTAFEDFTKAVNDIIKDLKNYAGDTDIDTAITFYTNALTQADTTALKTAFSAHQSALAAQSVADAAYSAAVVVDSNATSDFTLFTGQNPTWQTDPAKEAGSIYFQVGPNANQGWSLNIGNLTCKGIGLATGAITEDGVTTNAAGGNIDPNSKIDVLKMTGEGDLTGLLDTIDAGLTVVTTERSKLGAAQNRLEYTMKSLDITSENLSASESRIRDTDMAKEMMRLTKANVLQQAGVSMLAQANQAPQSILQLLR
jgi:flagellin